MKRISLDITKAACFLQEGAVKAFEPKVKDAQKALEEGTCPGNDFLGWLHLPSSITKEFLAEVKQTADVLRGWGLDPVIGPNVGKVVDGKYAGTVE